MNILILNCQVPFAAGGAELLTKKLSAELKIRGHDVAEISIPFGAIPKSRILKDAEIWKMIDLSAFSGRTIDLVIPTKFPTYWSSHDNSRPWLIHQFRQAYGLHGTRFSDFEVEDEPIRKSILINDLHYLSSVKKLFTISNNVSSRLTKYLKLASTSLLPPPPALGEYRRSNQKENFILSVGRLCSIKRPELAIRSLPEINTELSLYLVGKSDEPGFQKYLESEVKKHHLQHRVKFLAEISKNELLDLYAKAFLTIYTPFDEDYGFVARESLLSGTPVITCTDSGDTLSVIEDGINGIVVKPETKEIARAINNVFTNSELYLNLILGTLNEPKFDSWDEIVANFVN